MSTSKTWLDKIIQNRVWSHILFWFVLFWTSSILTILNNGEVHRTLIHNSILLIPQLLAAYYLAYYQVPRLLFQKKRWQFFLSLFLSIFVFSLLARILIVHIAEPFYREDFIQESIWQILADPAYLFISYFPGVYLFPIIMLLVKQLKGRSEEKHRMEVLEKEKAKTELNFLKAQIQPHFLFNTLNNLYALTLEKSDSAPEVVIKLSEILDYMLYQCNDPLVPLHKEIELLQNYLELEKLRYGDRLNLEFIQNIEQPNQKIAPLILISFVENAFKHGASRNPVDPKINIHLSNTKNKLVFEVYNNKSTLDPLKKITSNNGVGTVNVQRQLDLIYPESYDLRIGETPDDYRIHLSLSIDE